MASAYWFRCVPLLLLACLQSRAIADFDNLVRRVPYDANTITLIEVGKLMSSPMVQAQGPDFLTIPLEATRYVSAGKMDFETIEPQWRVVIMEMSKEPSFPKVAAEFRGSMDKIEGKEVVILPGDVYAVKLSPTLVAGGSPAIRQQVVRRIKNDFKKSAAALPDYLEEAQAFAEKGAAIIMAMDLEGVASPDEVRNALENFAESTDTKFDLDQAADVVASIRGISLGVTAGNELIGSVKVDFAQEVGPLKDIAKPFMIAALEKAGATIDELYDWDVKFGPKSVRLTGELGTSGLMRIMSLLKRLQNFVKLRKPSMTRIRRNAWLSPARSCI